MTGILPIAKYSSGSELNMFFEFSIGKRLYNPRSVVGALSYNQLGNYWISSGPYDEIYSAMVVYGFLSYSAGYVSIPNKELVEVLRERI